MNLYLVRHTEYENPQKIYPFYLPIFLSKEGRKNASKIGKLLVRENLHNHPIYTSPIVRCVQSAEIIAQQTDSFVQTDTRLIEVSCPNLQGKVMHKIDRWKIEQDDPSREPKNQIIARMMEVIKEKVAIGQDCIIVSHGEPLTFAYWHLTKQKFPRYPWNPKYRSLVILRGEVVKLEFKGKTFKKATKLKL